LRMQINAASLGGGRRGRVRRNVRGLLPICRRCT
jgi:hypothetical protein